MAIHVNLFTQNMKTNRLLLKPFYGKVVETFDTEYEDKLLAFYFDICVIYSHISAIQKMSWVNLYLKCLLGGIFKVDDSTLLYPVSLLYG